MAERKLRGAITPHLTPREVEALQRVADGWSLSEAAADLGMALDTIKSHMERIKLKLGVNGTAAAVAAALRRGLIE